MLLANSIQQLTALRAAAEDQKTLDGLVSILVFLGLGAVLIVADLEAFGFGIAGCFAFLHLLVVPVVGIVLGLLGKRRGRPRDVAMGFAFLAAAVAALVASSMIAGRQVASSKVHGDRLCQLLDAWRSTHGRYPERLEDLVPTLLKEVPHTRMGVVSSHRYGYSVAAGRDDYWLSFDSTLFVVCARSSAGPWRCDD